METEHWTNKESKKAIDTDRTEDTTSRSDERSRGLLRIMERTAWESRLKNFLASSHEEKRHQKVIDEVVNVKMFDLTDDLQIAVVVENELTRIVLEIRDVIAAEHTVVHKWQVPVQYAVVDMICRLSALRPNERDDCAYDEQQRVVEQEFPKFFHECSLSSSVK